MSIYNYKRRPTSVTTVGNTAIGGTNPIRVQSMTNTSTNDTEACVRQALRIAEAGGELVRLTTQGVREAANMANIKNGLDEADCNVPLVADVHFNPKAAFMAATTCDKVRINPGNFVDAARTFVKLTYSDSEYKDEIEKIRQTLVPFLETCKAHRTAIRLGVNHGSLSDRIMSRYGDTPEGMVESVMEYLRICRENDFNDIVISIKASNVVVMVETVRLLVRTMSQEDMHYPLHLGVTEAGDGEDGRIKSAVGIGTLLAEGIGDTIRVSLSEPPENEIPVAVALRDYITGRADHSPVVEPQTESVTPTRRMAIANAPLQLHNVPLVDGLDFNIADIPHITVDASGPIQEIFDGYAILIHSDNANNVGEIASWLERYYRQGGNAQAIIRLTYTDQEPDLVRLKASADFGALLLNGYGNAISLDAPALTPEENARLCLAILQACRLRITKTEYIACPSCGRTLFDLPTALHKVREATSHLKNLKIGVMGCIVNGPGEMADADYGYVGAGPDKVSLYKGKELVIKNIPADDALEALIELIKINGDWQDR
ncbi:MAG: (E)-4-hydroxy-3-methylbut-2-enyl-diphosphate synthase [Muribaculaceae bacterium]|nr:(E)-4-hydroxy-3-methylbut-2-enyl-diphosphate synthase [Muribaculaceae bacterium]